MKSLEGPRVANAFGTTQGIFDEDFPREGPPIDLLLSFAFHDRLDPTLKDRLPPGSLMWIDSGGFTAYTKGRKITVEQYADHLEANRGAWDYAFTLDVIGDHRASMRQTEDLINRGFPVTPIFTFGTPLKEFRAMCRDYGYIGAGGLVPLKDDARRVRQYLRTLTHVAEDYGTAVHALGAAGRPGVIQSRVWSADSSSVANAPSYGKHTFYSRKSRRINFIEVADTEGLYRYREDLLRYGFPLDTVMREKKWVPEARVPMLRTSLLSMAEGWEDLRRSRPVPVPERLPQPDSWTFNQPAGAAL